METVRITIQAATASGHRRGWFKHVTGIDTTKANGYALQGAFLKDGEHDLPLGAIVVEQYPTGSVKHGGACGEAFIVESSGLVSFATCKHWRTKFLSFRDAIAAQLAIPPATPSAHEALLTEKAALLARLAEIDKVLDEV